MIRTDKILGNISSPEWEQRAASSHVHHISLDEWMAQRSRIMAHSDKGEEVAITLRRNQHLSDGDVVAYDSEQSQMWVVKIKHADLMVIDLGTLARQSIDIALRTAVELGHALGNQHWAAVVRGTKVYVPLVADRRVMESVMHSHALEHIFYSFRPAHQIIPFLSPHEVRRLMGGNIEAEHKHSPDAK